MGDNRTKARSPVPPSPTLRNGGSSSNSLGPMGEEILAPPSPSPEASSSSAQAAAAARKCPEDFLFHRQIGEGSFSLVFRAQEVTTGREFAVKTCDKRLLRKEKKIPYVMREKEVMTILNKNLHPFFVRLYCTFQDEDRLFFVMTLAVNGEILDYLRKLGCFDEAVTRFYAAEIVSALEHLHSLGIVHRDLQPENILLNEDMHIMVSDFGSARIMSNGYSEAAAPTPTPLLPTSADPQVAQRRCSFVGTAQYVSPEVLNGQRCSTSCDFWALGCIVYQMLAGLPPFRGGSEYMIFQKIIKMDYSFPDGFPTVAEEFVKALLKLNPEERLGSEERGGIAAIKSHRFFADAIDESGMDPATWWSSLPTFKPPVLQPYLPATDGSEAFHSNYKALENIQPGLDDAQLTRLMGLELSAVNPHSTVVNNHKGPKKDEKDGYMFAVTPEERRAKLEVQRNNDPYHRFVEGNLVLKSGLVDKRKGLFARRRMLLLTEGPHLYYVDPVHMELKGQIPWSKQMRPEAKNFRIFFIHTTHRTYYLEDPAGRADDWCEAIEKVRQFYLNTLPETNLVPKKP